jgi:hypothetical protein
MMHSPPRTNPDITIPEIGVFALLGKSPLWRGNSRSRISASMCRVLVDGSVGECLYRCGFGVPIL